MERQGSGGKNGGSDERGEMERVGERRGKRKEEKDEKGRHLGAGGWCCRIPFPSGRLPKGSCPVGFPVDDSTLRPLQYWPPARRWKY